MECAKCIRNQKMQDESDADSVSSSNSTMSCSLDSLSESSDTNMSVNEACASPLKLLRHKREKKSCDVWSLLMAIISMF